MPPYEMLMKAGMSDVVMDFVERGVKHAAVINWDEPNPSKAFGLSRQDMKTFLGIFWISSRPITS